MRVPFKSGAGCGGVLSSHLGLGSHAGRGACPPYTLALASRPAPRGPRQPMGLPLSSPVLCPPAGERLVGGVHLPARTGAADGEQQLLRHGECPGRASRASPRARGPPRKLLPRLPLTQAFCPGPSPCLPCLKAACGCPFVLAPSHCREIRAAEILPRPSGVPPPVITAGRCVVMPR